MNDDLYRRNKKLFRKKILITFKLPYPIYRANDNTKSEDCYVHRKKISDLL